MGLEQNYEKALELFRMAAEQEDGTALAYLGIMYRRGWGVTQDNSTAVDYFQRAVAKVSPTHKNA